MKGSRTVIFNACVALLIAILTWVVGYDWTTVVSPTTATIIMSVANVVLRLFTNTEVFKKQ